jgi:hypothetical protein
MFDLDLVQVIVLIGMSAAISYFCGWMNGYTDGRRDMLKILKVEK